MLRTPRLYEQYQKKFLQANNNEVLLHYLIGQLKKDKSQSNEVAALGDSFLSTNIDSKGRENKELADIENLLSSFGEEPDDLQKAIKTALKISLSQQSSMIQPDSTQDGAIKV